MFQRSPSYDTGQDAIVRVTASDVRRRLLEHYGRDGRASDFQIQLPRGSYVPEIEAHQAPTIYPKADALLIRTIEPPLSNEAEPAHENPLAQKRSRRWAGVAIGAAACLVLLFAGVEFSDSINPKPTSALPPWNSILERGHGTQIVTSDPNVEELQELTGHSISISDYANHRFIPDGPAPTPTNGSSSITINTRTTRRLSIRRWQSALHGWLRKIFRFRFIRHEACISPICRMRITSF